MSNTTTRIVVGLVGIPAIIAIIMQGGWLFFVFVQVIAVLALKELYDLSAHKSFAPNVWIGYAACVAFGSIVFAEQMLSVEQSAWLFQALVGALVLTVLSVELWRNKPQALANTATTLMGVVYVGWCMQALLQLRMVFFHPVGQRLLPLVHHLDSSPLPQTANSWGSALVMCTFAGIWICDSAAFFAGKAFGNHKLFPRVSPNKSWEGALVGFVMSAASFAVLAQYFLPFLPLVHAAVLGALIGIVGQIGDLVESLLKRDAGVKDSSHIIPGHGGIFDRFDSILFAAPVTYLYVKALALF